MKSLAAKALIGFAKRIVIVGLLLFIPAWSLDFWQAWIFLILYFVSHLTIIIYFLRTDSRLVERRLKGGPRAEKRTRQKAIMALVALSVVLTLIVAGFDHRFNWSQVAAWLAATADLAIVAGFLIQFLAFKTNSFASAVITIVPEQRLIATGPYQIVRHPMYSGALVVNLFMPMALGSWWGLWCSLMWLTAVVLRILDEEALLRQSLPGYEDFCRKVPYRLFPYVW
jgi:protein-S-isoprenylcysteine O-methyltransferase Ste14